jgi:Flp pilus assembly pilin Flp
MLKEVKMMKALILSFFREEEGMETLEMAIILVVLVGIAFAFRKTLTDWYNGFVSESVNAPKAAEILTPAVPGGK